MSNIRRGLWSLILLTSAGVAQAGAPLLSEDAGVLEAGSCELEAATTSFAEPDVSGREHGLAVGCGAGHGWQWGVALARASAAGDSARGFALGGKVSLWEGDGAALALAPALSWGDDGQGWRQLAQDVNLAYSLTWTDTTTLHLNLGHSRDREADQRSTTWALALEHAGWRVGDVTLAPMGDIAGDDRGAPWWNLGLRATVLEDRLWVGLSYARQMDPARARQATLSVKLAF